MRLPTTYAITTLKRRPKIVNLALRTKVKASNRPRIIVAVREAQLRKIIVVKINKKRKQT